MFFTDWGDSGYATAAAVVRNLYRGEPVTTQSVARAMCTGEDTVRRDLDRAMRMGLVTRLPYGQWLPVQR